jgi:rsbT antagonist protein RsbS
VDDERAVLLIDLWDVLLVPLRGDLTDDEAEQLTTRVLERIAERGPRGLVVDLSGVALIDSHLCSVVTNLASASRLMGTASFLTGFSPEIALTLETMGVSFSTLETRRSVEQALEDLGIGPRHADDEEGLSTPFSTFT